MITLYDFDWKLTKGVCWNPHVWKVRYSLNFKGLEYKTVRIEYSDIAATMKSIGALPTEVQPNGEPLYTLPAIIDDSTGTVLAESALIAEYLDKAYPETPKLIPEGTHALQAAFRDAFYPKLNDYYPFLVPIAVAVVNPPSEKHLRGRYEPMFGMRMEDVLPKGEAKVAAWNKWKETVGSIDAWMKKNDVWVMGDTPSFADIILASFILSAKTLFGPDSEEYKDVLEMHGGRWGRLAKNMEQYNHVL